KAGSATPQFVTYLAVYSDTVDPSVTEAWAIDYSNSKLTPPATAAGAKKLITAKDGFGRAVREQRVVTNVLSEVTTRRYDAAGNVVKVDAPDPTGSNAEGVSFTTEHDGLGRV